MGSLPADWPAPAEPEAPRCAVCGARMIPAHRILPPTMGRSSLTVLAWRWTCSQSDGQNNRHHLEIQRRANGHT